MAVARPDYESVKEEKDMTEKEVTALVDKKVKAAVDEAILERTSETYKRVEDVPDYWRQEIAALVKAGALQGNGTGALGLTETEAKVLAVVARLMKGGEGA